MTRMKGKLAGRSHTSLFGALLLSFAGIIALLMSFQYLSYTFFRDNIRQELIRNSSLNLNTTVTNYEKHLGQLKSYLMSYLFRTDTQLVADNRGRPADYDLYRKVQLALNNTTNNSILYMENLVYYFRDSQLVIDKNGTRDLLLMFAKLYASDTYSAAFWNREIALAQSFRIYTGETFRERTAFGESSYGVLIPVLAKKEYDDQFGLIALLNGSGMYASFHQPGGNGSFYMFDAEGRRLFASSDRPTSGDPAFAGLSGQGHLVRKDVMYLYQRAEGSGNLYVDVIPLQNISGQIKRLNYIFAGLLLGALLLSLVLALLIARRFQHPLTGLVQAIGQLGQPAPPRTSRIKEFNLISERIHALFQSHHDINRDLDAKNSLLQHYAYLSRAKMIAASAADIQMAIDADRPYRLILFHLAPKEQALAETTIEPHRAYVLIKEVIRLHIAGVSPDSPTFQVERDHILTVLFDVVGAGGAGDGDGIGPAGVADMLEPLIARLQPETPYFNFTIGVSARSENAQQFAESYDEAVELVRQRTLGEDIQVFDRLVAPPLPPVPTLAQEQELATNLNAGNDAVCIPLAVRLIEQLHRAGAPAQTIQSLARELVGKAVKVVYAQHLTVPGYENTRQAYDELKSCYTLEHFERFFSRYWTAFGQAVRSKKAAAGADYMISFVKDYVESNYGDDISLERLADKLNITGSYLSAYFKEKTGTNLSEYTHTLRMTKAMEMLQNTDLKIQDIASLVGYFTVAPFNRAFKRYTGATPTEFRRQRQLQA